ncbi:3-keto-5-aminohexanoate cleavage protein [Bradyrhizobium sp. BR 10289]|uniref:3-keto-5-aminohexanoate cleavage protein n=1 Tax=Bradyrhizobium sp. BR 10289 TaxID=2749993 RepID=UPI001C6511D4|nr:3-keto-5-aminohexanoate cleavage protein [Bradyrhizobium sp. BR 10289]MBW7970566.1 3-keto-5-aminohexanoate cleavage protein [Bradyrhizobium sp. BR 10289]
MPKTLILGCCSTGAKYTPLNHHPSGDAVLDRICTGVDIAITEEEIAHEVEALTSLGCRYYHYHGRNPLTREQTTDNDVYRRVSLLVQRLSPDMVISFGASRNGREVIQRISAHGEWERVSHASLSLSAGGAHFITMQAAIELQIVCDLEDRIGPLTRELVDSDLFLREVERYQPSTRQEEVKMNTNSTANGNNYGRSSPAVQLTAYGQAVAARRRLHLLDEIEWVQTMRSYAMSRMAIARHDIRLAGADQLNVTLLFGFSPKLPFPETYDEFRSVVSMAKSLERDTPEGARKRKVSITVGAAILPHHAAREVRVMDVGPLAGHPLDAVRRVIGYAAQDDSEVDVVRVGMEDTPFLLDGDGKIRPTTNVELCTVAADMLDRHGVTVQTDPSDITERRAPLLRAAA